MYKGMLFCFATLFAAASTAAQYDLRLESPIRSNTDLVSASFEASDCSGLISLEVNSQTIEISAENTHSTQGGGCLVKGIETQLQGGAIQVNITTQEGSDFYQEQYAVETNAPTLSLQASSVSVAEQQSLKLMFDVQDDVDVSYLDVDVVGVKASDIRNNGGVVNSDAVPRFLATLG